MKNDVAIAPRYNNSCLHARTYTKTIVAVSMVLSGLPGLSRTRGQEWNSQTDHIRRRFPLRDGVKKFGASTRRNRIANGSLQIL